jgi:hypothetical protein
LEAEIAPNGAVAAEPRRKVLRHILVGWQWWVWCSSNHSLVVDLQIFWIEQTSGIRKPGAESCNFLAFLGGCRRAATQGLWGTGCILATNIHIITNIHHVFQISINLVYDSYNPKKLTGN